MHAAVCIIIKVFFKICRHIGEVPVISLIIRIKKYYFTSILELQLQFKIKKFMICDLFKSMFLKIFFLCFSGNIMSLQVNYIYIYLYVMYIYITKNIT